MHILGGLLPYTPELSDGELFKETCGLVREDDGHAVGLVDVRGDLGDKFVVGHSRRGGKVCGLEDSFPDLPGDKGGRGVVYVVLGDIQIGLVQAEGLHKVCV